MTPTDGPLTISDAAPRIRAGELTPCELLKQCLHRVDVYEPAVKAWAFLDRERARRDAGRLTDEAKRGEYRGPLHGVPVGVKDIIDVFDMPTGCGSRLWANSYARQDATCVERLRQAGAIVLGKTVTTPFAYLDPPPTRNPWNLDRTPGGSSSGSAAAVACGMCLAALGTQTGGSLIRPASYCGVACLKPTHGTVSVKRVLPLAPNLDHVGVMANSVRDLAIVFEAMAGPTPACTALVDSGPDEVTLFRLGEYFDEASPDVLRGYRDALRRLSVGEVEQLALPAAFAAVRQAHLTTMATEAAAVHSDRLDRIPGDYPPRIRELIDTGRSRTAVELRDAANLGVKIRRRFRKRLSPSTVMFTPAATDFAPTPETTGNPAFNSPWSFLGYPVVTVPAGWSDDGLPFGVQVIAGDDNEAQLLAVAAWAERCFGVPRRLPPVPA